jgi:hypothetical protein
MFAGRKDRKDKADKKVDDKAEKKPAKDDKKTVTTAAGPAMAGAVKLKPVKKQGACSFFFSFAKKLIVATLPSRGRKEAELAARRGRADAAAAVGEQADGSRQRVATRVGLGAAAGAAGVALC